jgi:hypothetical protein
MSGLGFITQELDQVCELCGAIEECRPYSPNGEIVCFTCGMKDEKSAKAGMEKYIFGGTDDGQF